jgi:hypothetical protein
MEPNVPTPPSQGHASPSVSQVVECFVREAEYMARLTIRFIDHTGIFPADQRRERPVALPAEFLLELAAVLRIAIWERNGLRVRIAADLPLAEDSYFELVERAAHRPESFSSEIVSPPLHRRVMQAVLSQLAWNGRRDLDADVLLGRPDAADDDNALEAMAEFLWARRHPSGGLAQRTREADRG